MMYVLTWVHTEADTVRVLAVSEHANRLIEFAQDDYAQTRHESKIAPLVWDEQHGADREVIGVEAIMLDGERYEIQEAQTI